ncbi:MAG: UDP-N-acetylmuramate dehydrogenase [Acidobacteria bacterium]|nr:UDP-N-acetylmuramate dehydrogenase [Acidobacteriota bacterium]
MSQELHERLRRVHPGIVVSSDAPLGVRTTYRVGGAAAYEVEVHDRDALETLMPHLAGYEGDVLIAGKGSNLLVADAGFDGLVLRLGRRFGEVEMDGTRTRVGGAAALPVVARKVTKAGLGGFEWAVGVPGAIGGAVRMNAGGHGSDMASVLVWADVVDVIAGEIERRPLETLDLAYRHSNLADHHLVIEVELQLAIGDQVEGARLLEEIVRWRREHQPGGQNAGSVFKNPEGDSAGRLIDAAGLAGTRVGTAVVSTKHANFIQVDAGGRADDVHALMVTIIEAVEERSGVLLEVETRIAGFDDSPLVSSGMDEPGCYEE